MPSSPFFVAEFPGLTSLAGKYTRKTPGATSDEVLEHALEVDDELSLQALGLLQRWPEADQKAFVAYLRRDGVAVRVIQRDENGTLLRHGHRGTRMPDAPGFLLHEAGQHLDEPWLHVEGGMHSIRARGRSADGVRKVAERLQAAWRGRGVACDVGMRDLGQVQSRAWVAVPTALHELARANALAPSVLA